MSYLTLGLGDWSEERQEELDSSLERYRKNIEKAKRYCSKSKASELCRNYIEFAFNSAEVARFWKFVKDRDLSGAAGYAEMRRTIGAGKPYLGVAPNVWTQHVVNAAKADVSAALDQRVEIDAGEKFYRKLAEEQEEARCPEGYVEVGGGCALVLDPDEEVSPEGYRPLRFQPTRSQEGMSVGAQLALGAGALLLAGAYLWVRR